nr:alpha-ketoglutarate-dependent dioxygenase AlkB [Fischerella sp. PCC 9605]
MYSKSVLLKPLPWTEKLAELRDKITALTGYRFNIVIGNQYRSGEDSIGWHSDNESSMGLDPAIASLSPFLSLWDNPIALTLTGLWFPLFDYKI